MVAVNFNLSPDDIAITGHHLGDGCSGDVYAFGPFVIKVGAVDIEEAVKGRCIARRLPVDILVAHW